MEAAAGRAFQEPGWAGTSPGDLESPGPPPSHHMYIREQDPVVSGALPAGGGWDPSPGALGGCVQVTPCGVRMLRPTGEGPGGMAEVWVCSPDLSTCPWNPETLAFPGQSERGSWQPAEAWAQAPSLNQGRLGLGGPSESEQQLPL